MSQTIKYLSQLSRQLRDFIPKSTLEDEGSGYFIRVVISPETSERDEAYGIYYLTDRLDDNSENLNDWHWRYQDSSGRTHCLNPASTSLEDVVRLGKELEEKV